MSADATCWWKRTVVDVSHSRSSPAAIINTGTVSTRAARHVLHGLAELHEEPRRYLRLPHRIRFVATTTGSCERCSAAMPASRARRGEHAPPPGPESVSPAALHPQGKARRRCHQACQRLRVPLRSPTLSARPWSARRRRPRLRLPPLYRGQHGVEVPVVIGELSMFPCAARLPWPRWS